jgi:methionine synthase I (cobalamin-dependent)
MMPSGSVGTVTTCHPPQTTFVEDIHAQYLETGADIIETNMFDATTISMNKRREECGRR